MASDKDDARGATPKAPVPGSQPHEASPRETSPRETSPLEGDEVVQATEPSPLSDRKPGDLPDLGGKID